MILMYETDITMISLCDCCSFKVPNYVMDLYPDGPKLDMWEQPQSNYLQIKDTLNLTLIKG